ncbi:hypothetical protein HYC85_012027 [Camellia sinensis]|uniref:Receptor-like serine/threonine-protein kinase n=1 Tax=Camellia sinensis TaxID=4442 RepID=A0A7J7HDP3_CAMSI|nr:hypothetical protein HYC85_012027 [Camellia sinensis]
MTPSAIHYLLFLSFLPFLPVFGASNITLGSSLSAIGDNSSWISPSEEFAFGFCQLDNTNIFLLAIWYAKIPDKTIIWHANTISPVQTESKVELTANGLTLNSPNGQAIWQAQPNTTISYAAMLNTGNFVLSSSTNSSVYVWESFSYPTDTILPTQVLSLGGMLYSRLTETNYSNGRFELHFVNGALELSAVARPSQYRYDPYYSSGRAHTNSSESGFQLVFNRSADIYIVKGNGSTVELSWPKIVLNYDSNYHRATLDFDGVFRQYTYSKTSVGCGVDDGSRNPRDLYDLEVISGVNWPSGNYDRLQPYNQTQCEQSCLHDCSCVVSIFDGRGTCWKKRLPLSDGRLESGTVIIKVRKGVGVPSPGNSNDPFSYSKKENHSLLWSILFGGSGFFNILLLVIVSLAVFSQRHKKSKKTTYDSNVPETNLRIFTFEELNEATQGFKEELGMGSFGIVYKGALKFGSKNQVAVKKLDKLSEKGEREFKTEVSAIGKTHHRNLVQLLGYCDEGTQRILVYELMTNGSLANFLFGLPRPSWHQRTQVALGTARGLVYLHEECDVPIIHCDIKPQNILIDEYFTARISDFGLAKSLMFNQSRTRTDIRGTRGYVAPEWFKNVPVTVKVDVYSFGVVLLEIICCRKHVAVEYGEEERAILTDWAYDCYMRGELGTLVDNDEAAMSDNTVLCRWVMTALCCIQEDPSKRPTMKMVIQMLEGYVEVPIPTSTSTSFPKLHET